MKWEYKNLSLRSIWELGDKESPFNRQNNGFDKLGQEGWELVSVDNGIAYFKRELKRQYPPTTDEEVEAILNRARK